VYALPVLPFLHYVFYRRTYYKQKYTSRGNNYPGLFANRIHLMDLSKVFVHNMKKYRKLAGLSQKKLAELCGASHSFIRQIECGSKNPSFAFIGKLAAALQIPVSFLFFDEEDERSPGTGTMSKERMESELIEKLAQSVHSVFSRL
jgi:transcriptional regulator with XRE-family HTH domain